MAIPDYETTMLPVLRYCADQKEHSNQETVEFISNLFKLNEDERKQRLPSGQQTIIYNRVAWAWTYMKKAGLLEPTRRSYFKITKIGLDVLAKKPEKIDVKFLEQFPKFMEFRTSKKEEKNQNVESVESQTPDETLEVQYEKLNNQLAHDLLEQVKKCSPAFFEKLVIELLLSMGYGGASRGGKTLGRTGDEGVDGVINEDKLGLDSFYIQAKRWDATVGRPEIQKFAGALQGQKAKKGIFITTSDFSQDSKNYVKNIETKIVLIDGEELAKLMIDHNIGVSTERKFEIKKIDFDYFSEE